MESCSSPFLLYGLTQSLPGQPVVTSPVAPTPGVSPPRPCSVSVREFQGILVWDRRFSQAGSVSLSSPLGGRSKRAEGCPVGELPSHGRSLALGCIEERLGDTVDCECSNSLKKPRGLFGFSSIFIPLL